MRLNQPRILPLPESEWDDATRKLLESLKRESSIYNIFRTLARYPDLFKRWLVFANHVIAQTSLPHREREIVILRIGWLCRAGYEWGHHVEMGMAAGLTHDEVLRVTRGAEAEGWTDFESTLIRAVDELKADAFVSDETWSALAENYGEQQLLDLVFAVGQYNGLSMVLNSIGVQLEEGYEALPEG